MGKIVCRYEGDGEVKLQVAYLGEITSEQTLKEGDELGVDFTEDVLVSIQKPEGEPEDGDSTS
jgi:hypothetical protein